MRFLRIFVTTLYVVVSLVIIGLVCERTAHIAATKEPSSAEVKQIIEESIANTPYLSRGWSGLADSSLHYGIQNDLEEIQGKLTKIKSEVNN